MITIEPYLELKRVCENSLLETLVKLFPTISIPSVKVETPSNPEFGELSSSVPFEISKLTSGKPREIAEQIVAAIDIMPSSLIKIIEAGGNGYINFHINFEEFSRVIIESVRKLDAEYGCVKTIEPLKIIVEHTSVNPIHPIHIGQARNPMLGDALARVLEARGHTISRHYYIDDMGRQSAIIGYGYEKLGRLKPEGKPDLFIGTIYTITSCIVEIRRLKKAIENKDLLDEEKSKLQKELDEWISIAAELENKFSSLFNLLLSTISEDEDPEVKISELIRNYESGKETVKQLIREVCQLCLTGFKETLDRAGVFFDSWDWESNLAWNRSIKNVVDKLKASHYVFSAGEVLEFNADKAAQDFDLKKMFDLREDHEIPSLTLVRADGTTLYPTRDIAYSLWKFERAEKVINVVGEDQTLPQLQLKLALYILGYVNYAKNLTQSYLIL